MPYSSRPPLAAATALLVVGCTTPEPVPRPAPTASASIAAAPPPPPVVTVTAAPSASTPPVPWDHCEVRLPAEIEAMECDASPRTLDYPDCRTFRIARLDGDVACQPERLSLEISGFQAIYVEVRAKVVWEAGPPRRARLVLERDEKGLPGFAEKRGTEMATLVFKAGVPGELRLGPGMRSLTRAKSAKITE